MAKSKGPLTEEHLKKLNQVIAACTETDAYCRKCEKCELDVDSEKERNAEQLRIAQKLKAEFFPGSK